jgi:hypothetical protein
LRTARVPNSAFVVRFDFPWALTPAVALLACGKVTAVSVTDVDDKNTLWRIRASKPVKHSEFVVGEEPPGFTTEVALVQSLRAQHFLKAVVQLHGRHERTPAPRASLPGRDRLTPPRPLAGGR